MKFTLLSLLGLTFFSGTVLATEYIYRDLMANTLQSAVCATESELLQRLQNPITLKTTAKDFASHKVMVGMLKR